MAQKELGRAKQQRQLGPGENFKDLPDREERIVEPRQGSLPPPPGAPEQTIPDQNRTNNFRKSPNFTPM